MTETSSDANCPGLPRRRPVRQDRDLNPPRIAGLFRGRTGKTARPRPAGRQAALRPQLGPVRHEGEWLSRTALVALVLLIVLGLLLGPVLLVIACWPCSWPDSSRPSAPSHGDPPAGATPTQGCVRPALGAGTSGKVTRLRRPDAGHGACLGRRCGVRTAQSPRRSRRQQGPLARWSALSSDNDEYADHRDRECRGADAGHPCRHCKPVPIVNPVNPGRRVDGAHR